MKRGAVRSLDDLRAFEAVARCGSVSAAAQDLFLTHGAISRRVTKLAREIDAPLLERDGRSVRLTEDGHVLATAVGQAFDLIEGVIGEFARRRSTRPIVLSCERSLALRWLIPRLAEFEESHPDLPIHLTVGGGSLDFDRQSVDLAIRRVDFPLQPEWRTQTLMREMVGPVLAPGLMESLRAGSYTALASRTRPEAWVRFGCERHHVPEPRETRFLDHHFLAIEAAASGLGVALAPQAMVVDDLARGRLVAPHGFVADGSSYALIWDPRLGSRPTREKLSRWLLSTARRLFDEVPESLAGTGPES